MNDYFIIIYIHKNYFIDMTSKTLRNHDKFYLNENRKDTPKEQFKFLFKKTRTPK